MHEPFPDRAIRPRDDPARPVWDEEVEIAGRNRMRALRAETWRIFHANWEEVPPAAPAEVAEQPPAEEVPAPVAPVPVVAAAAVVGPVGHAAQPRGPEVEDSESEVEDDGVPPLNDVEAMVDDMDLDDFDEEAFAAALAEFEAVFRRD